MIYFDMDGVLADFNRGVKELCGMEPKQQGTADSAYYDELWQRVKDAGHFYDRLELMDGAYDLFREVHDLYGDRCQVLTGIPNPKRQIITAAEDKARWMHRNFGEDIIVHTVLRKEKKEFVKGPSSILIDDYIANAKQWEIAGGTAILHIDVQHTRQALIHMGILR